MMKNYMQHLKERAISAYPPKTSRRWSICIAAAVIIGLLTGGSLVFCGFCLIDFLYHVIQQFIRKQKKLTSS